MFSRGERRALKRMAACEMEKAEKEREKIRRKILARELDYKARKLVQEDTLPHLKSIAAIYISAMNTGSPSICIDSVGWNMATQTLTIHYERPWRE